MTPTDQPPPEHQVSPPAPPGDTLWSRDNVGTHSADDLPPRAESGAPRPRSGAGRRRAAVVGTVLVIAAIAGTGLGMAVAVPGLLPGPPAAPGPAQPSYVIDTRATPAPTPAAAAPQPSPAPAAADYTVEAGDTLRSVAQKLYGDADLWSTLYDANRDTIGPDPDALQVGIHLRAPPR